MRQTNSHAREFMYTWPDPPPSPPPTQCCTRVHVISPEFQHCIGVGEQCNLKRITVLFKNSVLKTQKINAITQVSQGILSTIVVSRKRLAFNY